MSMKRSASIAGDPQLSDGPDNFINEIPTSLSSTLRGSSTPEEFTRSVKKRLASTSRTGQACDRCKVRKIRCDGLVGGCSPCRQNNTECRTTDRISHRAVPRGYIEQLEKKCANYEAKLRDMEAAMANGGLSSNLSKEVGIDSGLPSEAGSLDTPDEPNLQSNISQTGDHFNPLTVKNEDRAGTISLTVSGVEPDQGCRTVSPDDTKLSNHRRLNVTGRPVFLVRKSGDQHLGVYSENSYLNSTRASALSVLGIRIDLADLLGTAELNAGQPQISCNGQLDAGEPNNLDDSLQSYLQSTCRQVPPSVLHLSLPPKEEAYMLVEWNFASMQPYLPLLHKPTFMAEFHRMYDIKDYKTSPAQLVLVHIAVASSLWHMAKQQNPKANSANGETLLPDTSRAYRHYHFCLTLLNSLLARNSLEDCQAIISIMCFTRCFTRPGPAYLLSRIAMATVFELGLHRSIRKTHAGTGTTPNILEDELRKRAFWVAMTLDVGLCSKLSRPLSLRLGDYDVELPERIEDDYITETGFTQRPLPSDTPCSFDVAFGLFKCAEFTIEIHTQLYGAEKPNRKEYLPLVESIENRMTAWKDSIPRHLRYDPSASNILTRIHSGNLMLWYHELRIILRHPSLDLSPSPSFSSDNLTICVESSRIILDIIDNLRRDRHLDTAWYATTVPLLACMTLLFSIWEKRDTVTQNEIARVKSDMDLSVNIMKEYGEIIGANNKLGDVIAALTEGTMKMLKERHGNKPSTNGANSKRTSVPTKTYLPSIAPIKSIPEAQVAPIPQIVTTKPYGYTTGPNPLANTATTLYMDTSLPPLNSHVALAHATDFGHDHRSPLGPSDSVHAAAAALAAAAVQSTHQPAYLYAPHTDDASQFWYGGSESWKEYLANVAGTFGPADCFPATALMSLGHQGGGPGREGDTTQWPLMGMYDFGTGDGMNRDGSDGRMNM